MSLLPRPARFYRGSFVSGSIALFLVVVLIILSIYSNRIQNTSSTNQDIAARARLSLSPIDQKYYEIATSINSVLDPFFNTYISPTFDTIERQNSTLGSEVIADKKAQILCSPKPASPTDLEAWARWRACVGAGHIILANHYTRRYINLHNDSDRARANTSIYMMTTYLDTLITGPEYNLLSSIQLTDPTSTYKLRDTYYVQHYLPDSSGFYAAYGTSYALGTFPPTYCTSLEKPFDTGKTCKTINLHDRAKIISSGIAAKIASEWMIHSDGTLRTEYWDNTSYWNNIRASKGISIFPNTTFDPARGIGWYDLAGRRTMGRNLRSEGLDPYLFTWLMSGMADTAKLASANGGIFKTIYEFGLQAAGYGIDFDLNNINGDFATLNDYGQPLRGLSNYCNGTTNNLTPNILSICEGGTREAYQSGRGLNSPLDFLNLAYNSGQHLGILMASTDWGILSSPYKNNALNYYNVYKTTTTKDGSSYLNFNNGSFNETALRRYWPNEIKTSCRTSPSESYRYYKNPATGRVVTGTGENAAELLATTIPTIAHIVSQVDINKAMGLLNEYSLLLNGMKSQPLSPSDSSCAGGNWIGGDTVARSLWLYNNLMFGYFQFIKTPLPAIGSSSNPEPAPNLRLPQMQNAVIPDQVKWGAWVKNDLSTNPLFNGILPLDTRTVFLASNGNWFDSISIGTRGWNRITKSYSDFSGLSLQYLPAGGADLATSYPSDSLPYDTRVVYKNFDGSYTESVTKGQQAWVRSIPTWFNPNPWTLVTSDLTSIGLPREAIPPDSRTTYMSDTNLLVDVWIKGNYLWYRTFTSTGRASNWTMLNVRSYGFPADMWNGIDTIATWKTPTGQWIQNVTKGNTSWLRVSGSSPAAQPTPTGITPPSSQTPAPTISLTTTPFPTNSPTPTSVPTTSPSNTPVSTATSTPITTSSPTQTSIPSVSPTLQCPLHSEGDADCDNSIDLLDFEIFRQEYIQNRLGQLDPSKAQADFNNDKSVDLLDFEIFRQGYLKYRLQK